MQTTQKNIKNIGRYLDNHIMNQLYRYETKFCILNIKLLIVIQNDTFLEKLVGHDKFQNFLIYMLTSESLRKGTRNRKMWFNDE